MLKSSMGKGKNKSKQRRWNKRLKKIIKQRKPTAKPSVQHKSKKDYSRQESKKISNSQLGNQD